MQILLSKRRMSIDSKEIPALTQINVTKFCAKTEIKMNPAQARPTLEKMCFQLLSFICSSIIQSTCAVFFIQYSTSFFRRTAFSSLCCFRHISYSPKWFSKPAHIHHLCLSYRYNHLILILWSRLHYYLFRKSHNILNHDMIRFAVFSQPIT